MCEWLGLSFLKEKMLGLLTGLPTGRASFRKQTPFLAGHIHYPCNLPHTSSVLVSFPSLPTGILLSSSAKWVRHAQWPSTTQRPGVFGCQLHPVLWDAPG